MPNTTEVTDVDKLPPVDAVKAESATQVNNEALTTSTQPIVPSDAPPNKSTEKPKRVSNPPSDAQTSPNTSTDPPQEAQTLTTQTTARSSTTSSTTISITRPSTTKVNVIKRYRRVKINRKKKKTVS